MSKEKKSILGKLFGGSGGCGCGVQIIEEEEKKTDDNKEVPKGQKK